MKEQLDKTLVQLHPEESRTTQPGERVVADLLERIKNRKLAKSQVLGKMIRSTVLVAGLLVWACLSAQATSPGVALSPAQSYAAPALTTAADCPDPLATLRTMTVVDVVFEGRHTFRLASGGTSSYSTIALADACAGPLDRSDFGPSGNVKWEGRSFSQDASVTRYSGGEPVLSLTLRGNGTIAADGRSLEALDISLTPWYKVIPGAPAATVRSRGFVLTGPIPLTACSADAVEFSVTGALVPPRIARVVALNGNTAYTTPQERYESTDWGAAPTPKLTVRFSGPLARIDGVVAVPLTHVDSNRGFPATVRQSEQAPLADVKVELVRLRRDNTGQYVVDAVLASMNTQPDGAYSLGAPVDPSLAIRVQLQGEAVRVFDASAAQPGLGYLSQPPYLPAPATDVEIISAPFAVTAADRLLRRDILFDVGQGHTSPPAGTPAELRLSDFGLIYFHARQAWELAAMLNQALDTRPVPIYAYFPDQTYGAYWLGPVSNSAAAIPPHIVIDSQIMNGIPSSHRNDLDRPDNREWHEFGHHVQADAFANRLPRDAGQSHAGYKNSTSTDSWAEGFAEFYSLLINREVAQDGTRPELYHWAGGATNLEANVLSWRYRGASWEEFAVASLLWDLADPVDERDATYLRTAGPNNLPMVGKYRDHITVTLPTLWEHLTAPVAGNYPHILNIKQLHDVLRSRGVGQEPLGPDGMTALDEIFVAHGFFTDTGPHQFYYDAGEEVGSSGHLTVTLGTPPNQVVIPALPVRPSPPLSPEGWVRVDARDASGTPVSVSSYTVDVRFDAPFEHYNFSFEGRPIDGKLFVLTADAQYPATIAIRPNGFAAAAYTLRNDFTWNAPADANGVIAEHTFILGRQPVYLPLVMRRPAAPPTPTPTATLTPTVTPTPGSPPPSGWVTIASTDFEDSFPGPWTVYDDDGATNGEYYWGKRNCRAFAGNFSGWVVGAGAQGAGLSCGNNYPNNARSSMDYGPFSLVGSTAAELRYKVWQNTERDYDRICHFASVDNVNWYGTCGSGNSNGWVDRVFDLSNVYQIGNLLGQPQVWVELWFYSDSSVTYPEGVYVDNIVLRRCPQGATCPRGNMSALVENGSLVESPMHLLRLR